MYHELVNVVSEVQNHIHWLNVSSKSLVLEKWTEKINSRIGILGSEKHLKVLLEDILNNVNVLAFGRGSGTHHKNSMTQSSILRLQRAFTELFCFDDDTQ